MSNSDTKQRRSATLDKLASQSFDLLIIGGGITGAGVARDAALRGLKVALVEKDDFASGTSSRSSKLVHGGLRYLEHAQFRLVFEGTNERALLMRVAPHLVRPIQFLVPTYKREGPGLFVLDVGLWIYDALSKFSSPQLHRTLRARRVNRLEPGLRVDGLQGGIVYYDCMTDDARLTIENIIDAEALSAVTANHVRASRLLKDGDRVVGAELQDELGGRAPFPCKARVVVSATGPWTDELRQMLGEKPVLATSKGIHLVVDGARLPLRHAIVMKEKRRVVFAIPWGDRSVVGTTDTFYDGKPEACAADANDVEYLLAIANRYFPSARLTASDVLATWAGIRPLLRPPEDSASASDVSREHTLFEQPGLVMIAGGKLTTYRRMAAEVVNASVKQLDQSIASRTADRPLPGGAGLSDQASVDALAEALLADLNAGTTATAAKDPLVATNLARTYGARATSVVERIRKQPALGERLEPELPYLLAQIDVAVEEEQAVTVDDVLSRRVPLLLRSRDQGLAAAEKVAARMQTLLGWSDADRQRSLDEYRATVALSRQFRAPAELARSVRS